MNLKKENHLLLNQNITAINSPLTPTQTDFLKRKISFTDAEMFFPNGYESLFLITYILVLPYIAGLIFLLLFFSNYNIDIMQSIYASHSFFLTWCMGYEILAIITLIIIFKKFIFTKFI